MDVGGSERNWEVDVCALMCVKQTAGGNLPYSTGNSARCSVLTWGGGMRGGEGRVCIGNEEPDIYTHIADLLHCTAASNTTVQSNYTPTTTTTK